MFSLWRSARAPTQALMKGMSYPISALCPQPSPVHPLAPSTSQEQEVHWFSCNTRKYYICLIVTQWDHWAGAQGSIYCCEQHRTAVINRAVCQGCSPRSPAHHCRARACCCSYWETGEQSQQCPWSEIKPAAGRGAAAPIKSCVYGLVIKNHFINLVLSLKLYSQVLMSSVAVNEQYLTLNLWAAGKISWRKMLTAIFLINEGAGNAISASLRHLTCGKNILQNLPLQHFSDWSV